MEPVLRIVAEELASAQQRDSALLHWMQQLAPHGVFTTDNDLRIQTWNHWLETHSGLPATAVVGRSLLEAFPELVTRKLADQFHRALTRAAASPAPPRRAPLQFLDVGLSEAKIRSAMPGYFSWAATKWGARKWGGC